MPANPPMNTTMKKLATALQELTPTGDPVARRSEASLPACIEPGEFTFSAEVESFLERTRAHSVKTRSVHIGTY